MSNLEFDLCTKLIENRLQVLGAECLSAGKEIIQSLLIASDSPAHRRDADLPLLHFFEYDFS